MKKLKSEVFTFEKEPSFHSQATQHKWVYSSYILKSTTQLDPTNSNSVISNSLLFWTQIQFLWICPSVIYNQLFQNPAVWNYFCFSWIRVYRLASVNVQIWYMHLFVLFQTDINWWTEVYLPVDKKWICKCTTASF